MIPLAGGYFIPNSLPSGLEELLTEIVHGLIAIEEKLGDDEE